MSLLSRFVSALAQKFISGQSSGCEGAIVLLCCIWQLWQLTAEAWLNVVRERLKVALKRGCRLVDPIPFICLFYSCLFLA